MVSIDHTLQDSYLLTRDSYAATISTTMGTADIEPEDLADTNELEKKSFANITVLVPFESGSGKPNLAYPYEETKYLWCQAVSSGFVYASGMMPTVYQVLEDDLGFPGEAVGRRPNISKLNLKIPTVKFNETGGIFVLP